MALYTWDESYDLRCGWLAWVLVQRISTWSVGGIAIFSIGFSDILKRTISKTCSVNSVVASLEFHHFLSEHNLKKIRFIQVGPVAFTPWGDVSAPISKVGRNLDMVKLRHIAIDIGSVKTCFQEQAGWWLRFDLDNTAVSIFVDILVELTNRVFLNSTKMSKNI